MFELAPPAPAPMQYGMMPICCQSTTTNPQPWAPLPSAWHSDAFMPQAASLPPLAAVEEPLAPAPPPTSGPKNPAGPPTSLMPAVVPTPPRRTEPAPRTSCEMCPIVDPSTGKVLKELRKHVRRLEASYKDGHRGISPELAKTVRGGLLAASRCMHFTCSDACAWLLSAAQIVCVQSLLIAAGSLCHLASRCAQDVTEPCCSLLVLAVRLHVASWTASHSKLV